MNKPTEPKREIKVYKEYKFANNTMDRCLATLALIKQQYPDYPISEIVISTSGYCGCSLSFHVPEPNPKYDQELIEYNTQLEKYNSWLEAKERKEQNKKLFLEKNAIMKAARLEAEKAQQPLDKSIIDFDGKRYKITLVEK